MSEDTLWRLLPVVLLGLQGLFGWALWSMGKKFRTCEACDAKHQAALTRIGDLEQLRSRMELLPTGREINELRQEIGELKAVQRGLEESVKGLGHSLDRLDKPLHLLLEHHMGERR